MKIHEYQAKRFSRSMEFQSTQVTCAQCGRVVKHTTKLITTW